MADQPAWKPVIHAARRLAEIVGEEIARQWESGVSVPDVTQLILAEVLARAVTGSGLGLVKVEDEEVARRDAVNALLIEGVPGRSVDWVRGRASAIAREPVEALLTARAAWAGAAGSGEAPPAFWSEVGELYQELARFGLLQVEQRMLRFRGHSPLPTQELLQLTGGARSRRLERHVGRGRFAKPTRVAIEEAADESQLLAALSDVGAIQLIDPGATCWTERSERRGMGAHMTPPALARGVVERTLGPLVAESPDRAALLSLRVCDPAAGAGAFLIQAGEVLADALVELSDASHAEARAMVAPCLYGADRDPGAVRLARWLVARWAGGDASSSRQIVVGNSLIGLAPGQSRGEDVALEIRITAFEAAYREVEACPPKALSNELEMRLAQWGGGPLGLLTMDGAAESLEASEHLHWEQAFPEVFQGREQDGFDAVVGNPPWVAYAGRAAQPLEPALFSVYLDQYACFRAYRTLQALFVERAIALLKPRGRLGFVLPTSMADLKGYAPIRSVHDAACEPETELDDYGPDAFEGVFQPAMSLVSTKRAVAKRRRPASNEAESWPLARPDLSGPAIRLLKLLARRQTLPSECFGERGFQTLKADHAYLRSAPPGLPIRAGSDVRSFCRRPASAFIDAQPLGRRFRSADQWKEVAVLIRQTARFPIAALGDGLAFRNSLLAGFATEQLGPAVLCAYLNTTCVRWFHFVRFRDARQGMPQVKIAHLRSIPDFQATEPFAELAEQISNRNDGISDDERKALDRIVAKGWGLGAAQRALIEQWWQDEGRQFV